MNIPISKPDIDSEEITEVVKVLKSGQLAMGERAARFESEFAEFIGVKYAVSVSNGTVALYLALLALEIGKGTEVITTSFTFIANVEAILWAGAVPVFVDINPHTYNIDPLRIEKAITPRTKAILPVHLYGLSCDMDSIMRIAKKYNLKVIEDCAQAHGAALNFSKLPKLPKLPRSLKERMTWRKVGSFGDIGCFSFYATKNMTTGEGGMLTTNSEEIYQKLLFIRNHGSKTKYYHHVWGGNFRLTDIQATIGLVQLKKLAKNNAKRRKNAAHYDSQLENLKGLQLPVEQNGFFHVYHQYTVRIRENFPKKRDQVMNVLSKKGIGAQIYYPVPIHQQVALKGMSSDWKKIRLRETEKAAATVLSIPVHPGLTIRDLKYIVGAVTKI